MSPSIEAQSLIREIAGPMPAGTHIQEMLSAVARETKITFRRVQSFWHSSARVIRSDEMDALRAAAQRRRTAEEATRAEHTELQLRVARMESRLAKINAILSGAAFDPEGCSTAATSREDRSVGGEG